MSRVGSEAPHFGVGIPSHAISHDRLSAIVGASQLTDSCVRERKNKNLVLGPLRFLLVIREWLGLRDLVQDAGTFPFCRAVVSRRSAAFAFPAFECLGIVLRALWLLLWHDRNMH